MEIQNNEYLSTEVREILGEAPSLVWTWGTVIIAGVLVLFTLVGFLVNYPETVKGDLLLTTLDPPVPVISPRSGYLSEVRAKEGDTVVKDQILAVFNSNADVEDVLQLEQEVDKLSEFDLESLRSYQPNVKLKVGEISPAYSSFVSAFQYLPFSVSDNTNMPAILNLREHIAQLNTSIQTIENRKNKFNQDIEALDKDYRSQHQKYEKSTDEKDSPGLFEFNRKLSEKVSEKENLEIEIASKKEEISNTRAKILELQLQQQSGLKDKIFQLKQSLSNLKTFIQQWKDDFLVVAPAAGEVSFYSDFTERQFKKIGDELMVIIPDSPDNKFIGQVRLPAKGSGKVQTEQKVNIKFERYPHQEFGTVGGRVSKIFPLPKGDAYFVEVELVEGLKTSHGTEIEFQQQMKGSAEITTAEKKFISHLFQKIRNY
jgi:multidrug efflux pump subunit AcrA (membrane-fusion protein)